ncbi:MAG: hypothetical protein JW953_09705 [Anaerolineae bacterium]|nr:hypothetical protein [Anaerolineae bacterium]
MRTIIHFKQSLAVERAEAGFKRDVIGWVLVVFNVLLAFNSTFVFLTVLNTGPAGWLMLNTCAPSIFLFAAGFLLGSPVVMAAAAVLMFRYGTLGLLVFTWDGYNLIAQVGHILMTLAVIHLIVNLVRQRLWKTLLLGLAWGLAILIPLMMVQGAWLNAHPGIVEQLFSGNYTAFE